MSSTGEKQNGTVLDAILNVGIQHFVDWMQHTAEAEKLVASMESLGGAKKLDKNDPVVWYVLVGMLAMKTEAGRTTNHAASST
jgi:hypothetical protein